MLTLPSPGGLALQAAHPKPKPRQQVIPATEGDLLDLCEKRWNYARDAKHCMLETWATALAFYTGDQWRDWAPNERRLVKKTNLEKWRVLAVYNQIPGIVDLAAAKLSRARELPRCRPDEADDPEDRERAEMGTAALRSWWHREAMEQHEHELNVNRIIFGVGFLHLYWDPDKLVKMPVQVGWMLDEETGEIVPRMRGQWAPIGDACTEVLTVFDVFPAPGERFSDSPWVIVAKRKPVEWFEDTFGKKVEPDEADQDGVFSSLIPGFDGAKRTSGDADGAPEGEAEATLKILYEKPGKRYPQGRTIYWAGKTLLFSAERLPLPHQGLNNPLPVKMVGYRFVPKRLWPKGLVEECISPQRELNRGLGRLAEIMRLYSGPKRWIDNAWQLADNAITSAPDEVVNGDFQGVNPAAYVESPPNLPAWFQNYSQVFREELRHTANQNEISEGTVPGGVTAASAIALLQQSENQRLSSPALLGKTGLEDFSKHLLACFAERYREPRMVTVPGRGEDQTSSILEPGAFGPLEVVVEMADGVEDTDTFRQEQVRGWMEVGLFQFPFPIIQAVLEACGQTWLADAVAEVQPEIEAQQAEQQAMLMEQEAAQTEEATAREDQVRAEDAEREDLRRQEDAQLQAQQQEQQGAQQMALTAVKALLAGAQADQRSKKR